MRGEIHALSVRFKVCDLGKIQLTRLRGGDRALRLRKNPGWYFTKGQVLHLLEHKYLVQKLKCRLCIKIQFLHGLYQINNLVLATT